MLSHLPLIHRQGGPPSPKGEGFKGATACKGEGFRERNRCQWEKVSFCIEVTLFKPSKNKNCRDRRPRRSAMVTIHLKQNGNNDGNAY